ncbi:MAG: type 12 methyltransferase [Candidatus Gottesmanbacteria bacterium GW2011_GWB1_43_11]|uniref:Type 12 methyltransferase n=1 Tax=Candidatus Gottesmanbacteria bacterium GW2011_GWB1_43_11 TaxID=1618446 RepID=A0A0G1EVW6_9BACT|nr:MAG: type 12 methyltransferase [Candidatus Gottesmanbacteria bacterium GW2011_GWA2_42_16]KKS56117.1 MAG: type 12 methyltransferase [Candidatus Gottesmanbacteria bacterium GW2011_GWA1_42_26]KKS82438.1 MAG: type 12 methyltransferase [Candidatus Gottesmanbacteria bacterium GW2011_GWC1_43_10]KKS87161.1 MAG: type 12 methyltransferase [Candidatus Gottesmanbacteria bacterium GW2011_GWB1_43_11]OGG08517.1 MAG: hypothetical protein A2699_05495 [Candidatus Gottesmanbacteria bacterium RIFCSPHIGHO2_01_FU
MTHAYYHRQIHAILSFLVPRHKKILFFGSLDGSLLADLHPQIAVGIEPNKNLYETARRRFPKFKFYCQPFETYQPQEKFDFIILNGTLGSCRDFMQLLFKLRKATTPSTRIIVYQHNYLWENILTLAEKCHLKRPEDIHNWLSTGDVTTYLQTAGFERTRLIRTTLFPISLLGLGRFINFLGKLLPVLDFAKLDQWLIFKPAPPPIKPASPSLTICITVRDEEKNIAPLVSQIPQVAKSQEIIFVEGHSLDKTRSVIKKLAQKYPEKHIRLITQPRNGQADAIRAGFAQARGKIIILFEGDGTANPQDIIYFYKIILAGEAEFITGSRFVYPQPASSMPLINQIGNMIFAYWFSQILGQRTTDILSGIKAISKKHFDELDHNWGFLGSSDPFGDFELMFGAARLGLKIGEIPIRTSARTYGQSKTHVFTHGVILTQMALKGFWKLRF